MNGRVLAADTGAVLGEGRVELTDDKREGSLYFLLKSESSGYASDRTSILELETGERFEIVISGVSGPFVVRHGDDEDIGAAVTSFRVRA